MQLNGQKFSGLSDQFFLIHNFLGLKNAKFCFLKKRIVLREVFYQIKVQLLINWSSRLLSYFNKRQTLEILIRVNFVRIFKNITVFKVFAIHQ